MPEILQPYKDRLAENPDPFDGSSWTAIHLEMPDHDYVRILKNNGIPFYVMRQLVELTLDSRTALANYKGSAGDDAFQTRMTEIF